MTETSKRLELRSILSELFKESGDDLKEVVYLVQGKIAPDVEGKEIGIADKTIIEILSELSGKSENEVIKLIVKNGDLGNVARSIREMNKQQLLYQEEVTVNHVFYSLLLKTQKKGAGSSNAKKEILKSLMLLGSPDDAKYLVRISLGKLRLGVADSTILSGLVDAFDLANLSKEIESFYNFNPDLGEIS
ncbi:ATP-dependent DNA ligase, partial [mine drainage metagenome]